MWVITTYFKELGENIMADADKNGNSIENVNDDETSDANVMKNGTKDTKLKIKKVTNKGILK